MNENQEYILTEHDLIMSYTDSKGIITFVNDDAIRITGYRREELIGKPHNIVRDPDTPKQVYADMWDTIGQGRTWSATIKNHRKPDGFYWVRASITPLYQKEKLIGYMSVHRNVSREEINKISAIYAQMNAGTFKGAMIDGRIILNNGLVSKIKRQFTDIKIKHKLIFLASLASFSLLGVSGVNYLNTNRINDDYHSTIQNFKNTSQNIEMATQTEFEFQSSMKEWNHVELHGEDLAHFTEHKKAFERHVGNVFKILEQIKLALTQQGKSTQQIDDLLKYSQQNFDRYKNAMLGHDSVIKISSDTDEELAHYSNLIKSFQQESANSISETNVESSAVINKNNVYLGYALFLILSFMLSFFWLVFRDILNPLNYAKETLKKISAGNYLQPIDTMSKNEIGVMLDVMRAMSIRLGSVIDMEKKSANEHLAILIGLDNVTTGVLITNAERKIIYLNKAAKVLLTETESDLQKDLPHFKASQIMGANIDTFHKNPATQKLLLEGSMETIHAKILVGGRNVHLVVSPIINQFGHHLGHVVEWNDETSQVHLEDEISSIVHEAINGRFTNRFAEQDKEGFYQKLTQDLNSLLEVCESGFDDFKRVFSNMVQGNLTEKIEKQYRGDFDVLTQDANLAVLQLNTVVYDLNSAIDKVNYNIQNINEGNNNLANRTQVQTENVQQTVTAIAQLKTAVDQNDDAAQYANAEVHRVFEVANKGVQVIRNVVDRMEEIHASSVKVSDIISVIDGIAFQTNILALNAAVEAARAGDQGRGFAVVASEVRNLAQMAAGAAKEIKNLITDSEEKIESGGEFVSSAGKIMQEIASSIESVTTMMTKISHACSEQSLSIERINSAIMETENITKQNAELVVEAANSSSALEEEMKNLAEKTAYFKVQQNAVDFQLF